MNNFLCIDALTNANRVRGASMSHCYMIVVSGTSEYGKYFAHVFEVVAEDKEDAQRVAIAAMNEPLGVLREYRKIPFDPHAHVLSHKIEFIIQLD